MVTNGLMETLRQLLLPHCLKLCRKYCKRKNGRAKGKSSMIFLSLDFFDAPSVAVLFPRSGQLENLVVVIGIIGARKSAATVRKRIYKKLNLRGKSVHGFKQSRFAIAIPTGCWIKRNYGSARKLERRKARFKIFLMESKRTRSAWKNCFLHILMAMYQKRFTSNEKMSSCALTPL